MSERRLSSETRALVRRLDHRPRQWLAPTRRKEDISVLRRLGERGEPAAIPWILPFTLSGPAGRQRAALSAVEILLGRTRPRDVIWLDKHLRHWMPRAYWPSAWHQVSLLDLSGEVFRQPCMLRLASCHPNGFVREAALVRLATSGIAGTDVPFLIIRLNDWVPAVRKTADRLFRAAVSRMDATDLLPGVSMLPWIQQAGLRKELQWVASSVTDSLDRPLAAYARRLAIRSDDRTIRLEGFRALARTGELDLETVTRALMDTDPLIAGATLSAAFSGTLGSQQSLLRTALRSPHGSIRALAIRECAVDTDTVSNTLDPILLFDRSAAVREAARLVYHDLPPEAALEIGLEAIRSGRARQRAAALLGLAELGPRIDDIESILEEFRIDESARVRASVIRCRHHLNGRLQAKEILRGLADPSSRVARTTARLAARNRSVPVADLWNEVIGGQARHTRRYAFQMLSRGGKWTSLQYILKARRLPDLDIRELAEIELGCWFQRMNRSFTKPTESDRRAIRDELDQQTESLHQRTREFIEFLLR